MSFTYFICNNFPAPLKNTWLFLLNIAYFFRNLYWFRKNLWAFRDWDYRYNLSILKTSLIHLRNSIKHGPEIEETKSKRLLMLDRAIKIMNNQEDGSCYTEAAELQLQKKYIHRGIIFGKIGKDGKGSITLSGTAEEHAHNAEIHELALKIQEEEWRELWDIVKGNACGQEDNGSDMRGWWT